MSVYLLPPINKLFSLVDSLGVFVGALGGAVAAVRDTRYRYDLVGVFGLALAAALGGGIVRDIIVQHGPPLAFSSVHYLVFALAGATAGLIFGSRIGRHTEQTIIVIDAAALGLFAVAGSTRALDSGLGDLPALLLGVLTAVGGGSIRDVLSGRTPKIFERGQLYAIAALFGAAMFIAADALGFSREAATLEGSLSGFVLRILALWFNWQTKSVRPERESDPELER